MWVEKYRPEKLGDIVGQKDVIGSLEALLKKPNQMPHLMFSGSAGLGKTTTGLCIAKQVLGKSWKDSTLELNASDERGIDMVRERVKKFSRFAGLDTEIHSRLSILETACIMFIAWRISPPACSYNFSNPVFSVFIFSLFAMYSNLAIESSLGTAVNLKTAHLL